MLEGQAHRRRHDRDGSPPGPRLDKGLLDMSGRWLLLWLLAVIAGLWLLEQVGAFV